MEVRDKLNPQRSYRKGFALKAIQQHVINTNNPPAIGPDEFLPVHFPNLKENQVIIPRTYEIDFQYLSIGYRYNEIFSQKFR